MDDRWEIHYQAPDLPEPLPSVETIHECKDFLREGFRHSERIVRISKHYVVKYGLRTERYEGWTMVFVKEKTSVLVPKVYAIITNKDTGVNYCIMEFVEGAILEGVWDELDAVTKANIAAQLKDYLIQLRALPHQGCFGRALPPEYGDLPKVGYHGEALFSIPPRGVDVFDSDAQFEGPKLYKTKNPLDSFERVIRFPRDPLDGPFDTAKELYRALITAMRIRQSTWKEKTHPEASNFYERMMANLFSDEEQPTFTHGDLQRRNMVLRDDAKLVILDWGESGWYPSFWEYYTTMGSNHGFKSDWPAFIPTYLAEPFQQYLLLAEMRAIQAFCH